MQERALRDEWRTTLARWSLVALVLGAFILVAAWVHARWLPGLPYTWLRPLEGARDVAKHEHFPTLALLTLLAARSTTWSRERWRELARADAKEYLTPALRALGGGLVALFAASRFSQAYSVLDLAAALVFGAGFAWDMASMRTWLTRVVPTGMWSFGAMCLVAYGFTVCKAALFLIRTPVDAAIVRFESAFTGGADPNVAFARFAASHPAITSWADWVYVHSFEHILLGLVFLAALADKRARGRYIAAMSLCYVFGTVGYYLAPSYGPIFAVPERYAYLADLAPKTTLYRELLTQHLSDVLGHRAREVVAFEYVAGLPSLHVAQEVLIAYYTRSSRAMLVASLAFLTATLGSVVLLGWHYVVDIVGGFAIAALAVGCAAWLSRAGERAFGRAA